VFWGNIRHARFSSYITFVFLAKHQMMVNIILFVFTRHFVYRFAPNIEQKSLIISVIMICMLTAVASDLRRYICVTSLYLCMPVAPVVFIKGGSRKLFWEGHIGLESPKTTK